MTHRPAGDEPDRVHAKAFRSRLQAATRSEHERLDARFAGMFEAADARLYRRFIRMNHACHAAIEPRLETIALVERHDLTSALAADMEHMRLAAVTLPDQGFADAAEAAGAIYVLDGARLGARYMQRGFHARPPAWTSPAVSTHYLDAAAAADAFNNRIAAMASILDTPEDMTRASETARRVFALFTETLDRIEAEDGRGAEAA